MQYYLAMGPDRHGPFDEKDLVANGMRPETLVWRDGMSDWVRADSVAELQPLLPPRISPQAYGQAHPMGYASSAGVPPRQGDNQKVAAGICGILLGALGIHKFILGMNTAGVIMLLCSVLTCGAGAMVMSIIGIIEGITYLTKTDEEFYQLYVVQKKAWF